MVALKTCFSPPTDGIKHEQPSTKLFMNEREIGCGTLYITESKLSWRNDASGEGFSLLYPYIGIHAVEKDVQGSGIRRLLAVVDICVDDIKMNGEDNEDDDYGNGMTEMRFVPDDQDQLAAMYQAMTFCQGLHPNLCDSLSEGSDDEYVDADEEGDGSWAGGDGEYIEGQEPVDIMNGINGLQGLRFEEMENDGQFEDAEDH